jgi:hypothetical protein
MDVLTIALTRGFVALVDAQRFESELTHHFRDGRQVSARPSSLVWYTTKSKVNYYAVAFIKCRGVKWGIKLHRLLTEAPSELLVDHANRDTMDNRLANLRVCSVSQNRRNSRGFGTTSVFKGVRAVHGRFLARIHCDGQKIHLGTFATEEAAARAYDAAAIKHFGEFARLNFPQEAA